MRNNRYYWFYGMQRMVAQHVLGLSMVLGMVLGMVATSHTEGHTQTVPPNSPKIPAAQSGAKSLPDVGSAQSASGGLMGQLSRELAAIVRENRDGVVLINGYRRIDLAKANNLPFIPFPIAPQAGNNTIVVPVIGSGFLVQNDIVVTTAEVAEDIINPVILLPERFPERRYMRVVAKNLDNKANIAIFRVVQVDKPSNSKPDGQSEEIVHHPLRMGDSDMVLPGELAVTIGNQAGFAYSSGLAFISQVGRHARSGPHSYSGLIQFQGSVEPGSSGSPLFGPTGEVIGIVMAAPDPSQGGFRFGMGGFGGRPNANSGPGITPRRKEGNSDNVKGTRPANADPNAGKPADVNPAPANSVNPFGSISGIGFALPINLVKQRLPEMIQTAITVRAPGWMGVVFPRRAGQDPNAGRVPDKPTPGIVITNLREGSPADLAGLNVNDIVLQMDGQPITSEGMFQLLLRLSTEGQVLKLQIKRGSELRTVNVKLRDMPDRNAMEQMHLRVPPKDL